MEWLLRDLREAVRNLGARLGFTSATLVILAIGIGTNTATFSLIQGLLRRPLPYPDADRIVSVGRWSAERSLPPSLSNAAIQRLWEEARSFEYLAAFASLNLIWNGPDGPVSLYGAAVTPSLFPLLRTTPALGQLFTATQAVEGTDRVVLLSHQTWATRFGSDPAIIGAPVLLNDEAHMVIGVLPSGFDFPRPGVDFWKPLVIPPDEPPLRGAMTIRGTYSGIGLLQIGVSPAQAATEVRTILDRPGTGLPRIPGVEFETRVTPLGEERERPYRPVLLMLTAATGLVLLLACANVAGLLLARGVVQQRELAIRAALGAGRVQIVRQLLTESVVLSLVGGAFGLAVAAGIVRAAPALTPSHVPGLAEVGLDGVVLVFVAGLSVAAGLLFGAAPAFAWSRVELARTLNDGNLLAVGGFGGVRATRAQGGLAVVQVALALVLLTTAGVLLRSFVARVTIDLGLDPTNVVMARMDTEAVQRVFGGSVGVRIRPDAFVEMDAARR